MSKTMKYRKFIYDIENKSESINEKLESLKLISAKYHIIGYNLDSSGNFVKIKGYICFTNPRIVKSTKTLIGLDNVTFTDDNAYNLYNEISEMQSFWEVGDMPKRSYSKKNKVIDAVDNTDEDAKTLCNFLLKQNNELMEKLLKYESYMTDQNSILLEQNLKLTNSLVTTSSEIATHSIQQTNTNSHNITNKNKTFNINMFLNEQCKDAITLTDFIKNIQIENEDLFYAKDHGYVESMIRVLTNSLKQYNITERPLHCTDVKRETMHIKNEQGWIKEKGSESEDITKAINTLSHKKIKKASNYFKCEGKAEYATSKGEENIEIMTVVANGNSNPGETVKKVIKGIAAAVKIEDN